MRAADDRTKLLLHAIFSLSIACGFSALAMVAINSSLLHPEAAVITGGALLGTATYLTLHLKRRACAAVRIAQQSRESEREIRQTLDAIPAFVWRSDVAGTRTFLNKRWRDALRETGVEGRHDWKSLLHDDDRDRYFDMLGKARRNETGDTFEFRLNTGGGEHSWVKEIFVPLGETANSQGGHVGVGMEVTDHILAEEAARRDNRILLEGHRLLDETVEKLQRECAELRGSIETLKTPPRGRLDTTRSTQATCDQPHAACRHGVMDIDDIAPGDEAPAAGASGAIDVRDIIRQVVDDATQRISRKNIDLRRRIARNIPGLVDGSCEQLYQALLDCASGASALAERGNVLIECAIDDQQDDRITLRFVISHDRGAIAQGDLARLLGPGCNAPVEEEPHGEDAECEARVSLATARRHIASLGGQLHVENDPAGGFRFWFLAKFTLGEFASSNRRQHVRLSQDSLTCNLGEIADISLGGMRIVSNKPYEGIVDIELTDDETTLSIRAEVVRCTRVKFRNHDIGLQFINLTADHRDSLSRISIRNRMRRTIRSEA